MPRFLKISTLIVLLTFASCKKIIDVVPITELDASLIFSDDQAAISAVVGLYAKFVASTSMLNSVLSRSLSLYADDLTKSTTTNSSDNSFLNNQIKTTDLTILELWNSSYYHIYFSNIILLKLKTSYRLSTAVKKQLEGETKFVRALVYFYLVNLFGDIPLVLDTDPSKTAGLSRYPAIEIYRQIVSDLQDAKKLLSLNYPVSFDVPSNRIRANKGAAAALLAKVYLYMKDYINAELQSSWVINCDVYGLEANPDNVFLAKSNETILGLCPLSNSYNTIEAKLFAGNTTRPSFILTESVLNGFEGGDLRTIAWMRSVNVSGKTVKIPYKYKVVESDQIKEYIVLLRLAEVYLIRAEVNAMIGKYKEAIDDINQIRNRSRATLLLYNLSLPQIITAVEQENQREFFTELGHRWFDLRR